jgi:hypothetical protein
LLLVTIAPAFAQQRPEEKRPEEKRTAPQAKPEQPRQPAKPPARPPREPQPSYGGSYHGGVQRNGPTHGGVHQSGVPQHTGQVRSGFVQSRAKSWNTEHRTWEQRGGYTGYRIPQDRFRTYFGRDHFFSIAHLPMRFVGGYPSFQYDGFWVTFADPWPEGWAPNWYETDDCYIDYVNDGYYVFDRAHPGIAIAVNISL